MGNETSSLVDDDMPPSTLRERSLAAVAELIRSDKARQIVVLSGAGISTAAGIPDFRSPDTGLYHSLAHLDLPYPEAVFEIEFFRKDPSPFYALARELSPGKFYPTIAHVFVALLAEKGLLRMLFTQNIDCLDRFAGVPGDLIVEAHGSFATHSCTVCKKPYPDEKMREHIERAEAPHCRDADCSGMVKPDIVFFGEQLPARFFDNVSIPSSADLMLILGTSLSVHPFASLPTMAGDGIPRVLFNRDVVGGVGSRADDVICIGDCDSGVRKLADELGWRDELEAKWRALLPNAEVERQLPAQQEERDLAVKAEIDELTKAVEDTLTLSASAPLGATEDMANSMGQRIDIDDQRQESSASNGGEDGKEEPKPQEQTVTEIAKGPNNLKLESDLETTSSSSDIGESSPSAGAKI